MTVFGPSDWMKKKKTKVLLYTRISDNQQSKDDKKNKDAKKKPALIEQRDRVLQSLKANGLPTSHEWFAEVKSGTDRDRGQWNAMLNRAQALAVEGNRVFIAVQDPSRFSRNTRHAMVAIDRLHDLGIPVFATREGIQTGSLDDLHPTEELLFVQLQGGASFVSQQQKEKADISVAESKEKGTMSSKGNPLFPFAREDPLEAYYAQLPLFTMKPSEGGGPNVFRGTVSAMTAPDGPTIAGVKNMENREALRLNKLTRKEYEAWREYRTKIRNLLIELEHDPFATGTKMGKPNFKAKALMRMTGRYLKEPWAFSPRTDEEIEEILTNFKSYLGTKALKNYVSIVGKR
jgi:DNA invertase Pin-like site-specific DNA recombinase